MNRHLHRPSFLFAAAALALLPTAVTIAVVAPFDVAHAVDVPGVPAYVDYQGRVTDAAGAPLAPYTGSPAVSTPKNYTMYFRIYDAQSTGTLLWSEQQTVTVDNGAFSVRLGEGTAIPATGGTEVNPAINTVFGGRDRYLGVTVVVTGQTSGEISPRLAFLTVPFAMSAQTAQTAARASSVTQAATDMSANTFYGSSTFNSSVTANSFTGSGASLTSLNANNISSGTVADARLSANIARLNADNSFSGLLNAAGNIISQSALLGLGGVVGGSNGIRSEGPLNVYGNITNSSTGIVNITNETHVGYGQHIDYPFQVTGGPNQQIVLRSSDNTTSYDRYWKIGASQYNAGNPLVSHLYFTNQAGNGLWINGASGAVTSFSDVRLKEDIAPLTGMLDRLLQLRGVAYRFKSSVQSAAKTLGLIAQEVEPLFPEAVSESDTGYKGISYSELIPVTITALQEEHQQVQEMGKQKQTEIDELREQNKKLKEQLDALGTRLDLLDKHAGTH